MKDHKNDRRVKYTIMVLKEALIEALLLDHISKISVKALCESADINRSTFYAHFSDQYDLLKFITQEVIGNIEIHLQEMEYDGKSPISLQVLKEILEYIKDNANLFKALLSDNCDSDIHLEIMQLTKIISEHSFKGLNERTKEYLIVFGMTGAISILNKWLQDNTPESPEKLAKIMIQAINEGVTGFK